MQPQPATIFGLSRGSVRRSLWLLLGLAHLPALFGTLQTLATDGFSADRLAPCLLLALAIVFFALKTWNVAALRFRTDRRSCVTLIIVVAMLHLDVLRPESGQTRVPMVTALVATTWIAAAWTPLRRSLGDVFSSGNRTLTRVAGLARSTDGVWLDAFRPHCWILTLHAVTPRAPPA